MLRLDEQGNSEEWFFTVLFNDDVWKEFKKWMFPNKKSSNFYNYTRGDIAIDYNYLSLIQSKTLDYSKLDYNTFRALIGYGKLEIAKIIYASGNGSHYPEIMTCAAKYGHLDMVKFLHSIGLTWQRDTITVTAENGYLEVIKYLCYNDTYPKIGCTSKAVDNAAKNGHIEVVKYLVENKIGDFTTDAIDNASSKGDLDMVMYLYNTKLGKCIKCSKYAILNAIINGHLEVVRYLYYNVKREWEKELVDAAAINGHLEILRFLWYYTKEKLQPRTIYRTIRNGYLEVVKFMCIEMGVKYSRRAIDIAYENGHIELAQFLT